jgi:hypothetical protein
MKYDNKNALKLQISTYLEESLSMVGRIMLEDIFNDIDIMSDDEAGEMVEAHYDNNIFELIAPYVQHASEEYEVYKRTPEGKEALEELKKLMEEVKDAAIKYDKVKVIKNDDNEGNGNVH